MNIPLDYYRVFYYAAKYRNLSQAAAALYSSQPNVTRTIHMLEQALGCPLFLRSNRGVTLTPEGELLYGHAAQAMIHLESAEEELIAQTQMHQGTVSIGASEVALHCLLLPVLGSFRSRFPGIRVRVSNHSTPQAIQALREGLVDLAVVTTPVELGKGMEQLCLKTVREVPVCRAEDWDKTNNPITPEELCRHSLISLGRGTMSYRLYESWFSQLGLPFHPDIEAATADQVLPMVQSGLGIGFVPEEFLLEEPGDRLTVIPLTVPLPQREICLVRFEDRALRFAARQFEGVLREAAVNCPQTKL